MRVDDSSGGPRDSIWTSLFLLGFGIAVLAFLVVIDRHEWMSLPTAGGSASMSYAAQNAGLK